MQLIIEIEIYESIMVYYNWKNSNLSKINKSLLKLVFETLIILPHFFDSDWIKRMANGEGKSRIWRMIFIILFQVTYIMFFNSMIISKLVYFVNSSILVFILR